MAKKTNPIEDKETKIDPYKDMTDKVSKWINQEYTPWKDELKKFWPQMDKNDELYQFYKEEAEKSPSKVALNSSFSIVESMIAKENQSELIIKAKAKGFNDLQDFEEYTSGVIKDAIEDPDVAELYGTFRKNKEMHSREYHVIGNAFSESQYAYVPGKVDNPFTVPLSFKCVIFNPAYYADNSPVYYIEKNTNWKELNDNKYDDKTGHGLYTNLELLKEDIQKDGTLLDSDDEKVIANGAKVARKREPIRLLFRWEGSHLDVIANDRYIIRSADDPFKTGSHNLYISMRYKKVGRPYAYGDLDPIYKTARAQDTIVNQNITSINKYLEPAMGYDPNAGINVDAVMAVLESGGLAPAPKDSVYSLSRDLPPTQAFTTIDTLQQAMERAARFSPYATGVPSQVSDKTQGTASGIQSIQNAAEPNFQTCIDDLKETYLAPIARKYLKMIANLMSPDDVRYALLKNKKPLWVKATKGILTGKATIDDLLICGFIDEQTYQEYIVNPQTGLPDDSLKKSIVFDIDWIIDVELDNQAEADKQEKTQRKLQWYQMARQSGVQIDNKKFITQLGREYDIEDPEQYYLTDQQIQQQQMQAEQQQQSQIQQQQEQVQADQQNQLAQKQMELEAKQNMARENMAHQKELAVLKNQPQPMMA